MSISPVMDEQNLEPLLTVGQVAARLSVSQQFVRDHATRCKPTIPCVRLGSLLRFRNSDVTAFIEQQLQAAPFRRRRKM
jgi:excisionase family DNA binding protein